MRIVSKINVTATHTADDRIIIADTLDPKHGTELFHRMGVNQDDLTAFDPSKNLILIQAQVWGPLGDRILRMALDTGATDTLIVPYILDSLG